MTFYYWPSAVLISAAYLSMTVLRSVASNSKSECGGKIRVSSSGNLTTPGYPGNYPKNSFCIWLLEAQEKHIVELTIHEFAGHIYNNTCLDYIQIRDGSKTSDELFYGCNTVNKVINSTRRWLWVMFKSNSYQNNKGLISSWRARYTGKSSANETSPISVCINKFQCPNGECIPDSSQCNGINDCGCIVGCDEHVCSSDVISFDAQLAIGISIGVALFAILFCGTLFVEWRNKWTKNVQNNGRATKGPSKAKDSEVTERLGEQVAQSPAGLSTPTTTTTITNASTIGYSTNTNTAKSAGSGDAPPILSALL